MSKECKNCKWCLGYQTIRGTGYYICDATDDREWVEDCIANDPELDCDLYENLGTNDTSI